MKNHKRRALIYGFLLVYALFIFITPMGTTPNSQTHRIDTNQLNFGLDNGQTVSFNDNYIYLGDADGLWSLIDSSTIRFYNLKMGDSACPSPFTIQLDGGAVAVSQLFEDKKFIAVITGSAETTSTTKIYVGSWGKPDSVSGASSWSYDETNKRVIIIIYHESAETVTISWLFPTGVGPQWPSLQPLLQFLYEGDFLGFTQAIFVRAFLSADLFYGVVLLLFTIPLYIRTKSILFMSILWILVGGFILVAMPIVSGVAYLLLIFGLAGMMYKLYMRIRGRG